MHIVYGGHEYVYILVTNYQSHAASQTNYQSHAASQKNYRQTDKIIHVTCPHLLSSNGALPLWSSVLSLSLEWRWRIIKEVPCPYDEASLGLVLKSQWVRVFCRWACGTTCSAEVGPCIVVQVDANTKYYTNSVINYYANTCKVLSLN